MIEPELAALWLTHLHKTNMSQKYTSREQKGKLIADLERISFSRPDFSAAIRNKALDYRDAVFARKKILARDYYLEIMRFIENPEHFIVHG